MSYWFGQMQEISDRKYPEQIAYLRENHGFTQAHANALVLYSRGSTSAHRFNSLDDYLKPLDDVKRETVLNIFNTITKKYPKMEVVIAWNKPMLKLGDQYVFALSVHAKHIVLAPWGDSVIARFESQLAGYETNKKTIKVPVDWKVDKKLLLDLVTTRISELA